MATRGAAERFKMRPLPVGVTAGGTHAGTDGIGGPRLCERPATAAHRRSGRLAATARLPFGEL